jgi:hypothetical protein
MNKKTHSYYPTTFRLTLLALTFALFLLLPAGLPEKVSACACCSNAGQWFEQKRPLDENERDVINEAKLSAKAQFYESSGEDEGIAVKSSDFTLKFSRVQSKWTMTLQGTEGDKGTLTLNISPTATVFAADPRDGKVSNGGGPLLYKEVRLEGRISGTGVFAKSIKADSRFRLILQGRGNACLLAQDFSNWVLQIYGKQARFGFYGAFDKKAAR